MLLLNAAYHGSTIACKLLLAAGSDVNRRTKDGLTPLHLAALFGKFYLPEVLSNDLLDFSPASQIPPFPPASVAACAEICNGDEDM